MTMRASLVLLVLGAGSARAEHDHGPAPTTASSTFGASVSLFAARYDQMLYEGDYQGFSTALQWSDARFAVSASLPMYRLVENGRTLYGPGDGVVSGQVTHQRDAWLGGIAVAVSVPTGERRHGLGMGHAMVMPAMFLGVSIDRVRLAATTGYGRALGDPGSDHDHGQWPIVEPMNLSELTWGASADVLIVPAVTAGARLLGAVPIGDGQSRVVAGARTAWTAGRVGAGFEIQAGLHGDPFSIRGVFETTVRF
jgi:hypothetical protein